MVMDWNLLDFTGSTGDDYALNQTLCRRDTVGNEYLSTGRTIKIVMVTDASVQRAGFNITIGTSMKFNLCHY